MENVIKFKKLGAPHAPPPAITMCFVLGHPGPSNQHFEPFLAFGTGIGKTDVNVLRKMDRLSGRDVFQKICSVFSNT